MASAELSDEIVRCVRSVIVVRLGSIQRKIEFAQGALRDAHVALLAAIDGCRESELARFYTITENASPFWLNGARTLAHSNLEKYISLYKLFENRLGEMRKLQTSKCEFTHWGAIAASFGSRTPNSAWLIARSPSALSCAHEILRETSYCAIMNIYLEPVDEMAELACAALRAKPPTFDQLCSIAQGLTGRTPAPPRVRIACAVLAYFGFARTLRDTLDARRKQIILRLVCQLIDREECDHILLSREYLSSCLAINDFVAHTSVGAERANLGMLPHHVGIMTSVRADRAGNIDRFVEFMLGHAPEQTPSVTIIEADAQQ